ncbi:hypothetical protein EW146_g4542 [Bondarzewia mesenterica]|uniref:Uncharacterized protein n=1 Tax=Bondarzewia mesenterica TaxID=1095465 RepID=A0A4S4LVB8_9AGAM|nr:hypothetical protein EW146_g4542 [Bondarzewia mesenterica]
MMKFLAQKVRNKGTNGDASASDKRILGIAAQITTAETKINRPDHPSVSSGSYFVEHLFETSMDSEHSEAPSLPSGTSALVPPTAQRQLAKEAPLTHHGSFDRRPAPPQPVQGKSHHRPVTTRHQTDMTLARAEMTRHRGDISLESRRPHHRRTRSEGPSTQTGLPHSHTDVQPRGGPSRVRAGTPLSRAVTPTPNGWRPSTPAPHHRPGSSSGKLVKPKPPQQEKHVLREGPPNKLKKLRRTSERSALRVGQ